jgi:hypothetical protein
MCEEDKEGNRRVNMANVPYIYTYMKIGQKPFERRIKKSESNQDIL